MRKPLTRTLGDGYNPIKRVLLSWIGKEVPAGLQKARAAGHKKELIDFINVRLFPSSNQFPHPPPNIIGFGEYLQRI